MQDSLKKLIAFTFWCMTVCLLCFFSTLETQAQSKGDYRSVQNTSGNSYVLWSNTGSWEYYNGSIWKAATDYPGEKKTAGTVTMRSTHYCLIDVSPAHAISNLVLQSGTASDIDNGTLLGFQSGVSRTLKVTGDITLGKHAYMGVNIYDMGPADVQHTLEIGGT